jgi:hypothetical protein
VPGSQDRRRKGKPAQTERLAAQGPPWAVEVSSSSSEVLRWCLALWLLACGSASRPRRVKVAGTWSRGPKGCTCLCVHARSCLNEGPTCQHALDMPRATAPPMQHCASHATLRLPCTAVCEMTREFLLALPQANGGGITLEAGLVQAAVEGLQDFERQLAEVCWMQGTGE